MKYEFDKLLNDCRNFERKAQRQMVDLLAPFLFSVCKRYAASRENAQDLVQESFILIFNNIQQCQAAEKPFMGWCRRIAVNVCLEKFRKKSIPFENMDHAENDPSAAPDIFDKLGVEEILQLLQLLPENQSIVFNLYVIDGYNHAEIGDILRIKESNSRTLLTRARATLQGILHQKEFLNNEHGSF
jgi:RNA polymerase sigma factor (sigma-70 family)